ncbi:GNAT family N-acetyltransferase [Streptomyces maremycinicus]|uniref:GNAT family N-acetyltransferase n=1 Tax=Streptomyces maremycinicus TaxID=1679753 RepID=UPI001F310D1D|nr:N-acetyltransferase [Streptomyces sp. NBRC 110468]
MSGERPLRIRAVTEEDLEADLPRLVRLDADAFPHGPYPFFVLRQLVTTCAGLVYVVDDGTDLHGYVLGTPPNDAQSWVCSLAITPGLRGKGFGRLLMTKLLGQLRVKGAHAVRLSVEPRNDSAIALYRSLGFVPDPGGPRADYFGPGEDRLLMTLTP